MSLRCEIFRCEQVRACPFLLPRTGEDCRKPHSPRGPSVRRQPHQAHRSLAPPSSGSPTHPLNNMSLKTTGPSRIVALPKRVARLKLETASRASPASYPPPPRLQSSHSNSTTCSPSPSPAPTSPSSSTTSSNSSSSNGAQKSRIGTVGLPPRSVSPHPKPPEPSKTSGYARRPSASTHAQSRLVFDTGAFGIPKGGVTGSTAVAGAALDRLGLGGGGGASGADRKSVV